MAIGGMGAVPASTRPLREVDLLQQWLARRESRDLETQVDRAVLRTTTRR